MDEAPITSGKNNEWFTPAKYIEAAKDVMGGIDLDPASCELANRTVKATKYYTKEDNGLMKSWHGRRVWLNPPYGKVNPVPGSVRSYQKLFVEKLLQEHAAGRIEQAILLLLGNCCFTHYFYPLWQYPLCFHDGFISFWRPDGSTSDFGFGTIFVYLGPHEDKFTEVFSKFGRIVKAIDARPSPVTQPSLFDTDHTA
jgi:ParB family chromosome partitioning protein